MARKNGERVPLPPYISFKTFLGFIQRMKEMGLPERIDSSILRTYSGSVASNLTTALKYLKLIEDGGQTTAGLQRLVATYDTPHWQSEFREILDAVYKNVIGNLKLEIATPAQLDEKFKALGAGGEVLRKCVLFYLAASQESGAVLSPHILNRPRSKPDAGRNRGKKSRKALSDSLDNSEETPLQEGTVRFSFPVPGCKASANLSLPSDIELEDWEMVSDMVKTYIKRRQPQK